MAGPAPAQFWNVPNTLTLSRLVLAFIVFGLIGYGYYFLALAVFGLASLTDALDGYFARLLGQSSAFGRQFDPLIDKVIVAGAFIYLLKAEETGLQPWMVTTIVVRELLIQGLRSLMEGQGQAFGAKTAGKLKTLVQCLSISAILLVLSTGTTDYPWLVWVRDILTWLAVGLTVYSGLAYIALAIPNLRGPAATA